MNNNQKGFSAVEGLLILVIVGIIGGVGGYVYWSSERTSKVEQKSRLETPQKVDTVDKQKFCGGLYAATIPSGWNIYDKNSAEKSHLECYIQSYSDNNPDVPPACPYLDGLAIDITRQSTTETIETLYENNKKEIGVVDYSGGDYSEVLLSVEVVHLKNYNAVHSKTKGGHYNTTSDNYQIIVNGTEYLISGYTTNSELQKKYDEFVKSFEILNIWPVILQMALTDKEQVPKANESR